MSRRGKTKKMKIFIIGFSINGPPLTGFGSGLMVDGSKFGVRFSDFFRISDFGFRICLPSTLNPQPSTPSPFISARRLSAASLALGSSTTFPSSFTTS